MNSSPRLWTLAALLPLAVVISACAGEAGPALTPASSIPAPEEADATPAAQTEPETAIPAPDERIPSGQALLTFQGESIALALSCDHYPATEQTAEQYSFTAVGSDPDTIAAHGFAVNASGALRAEDATVGWIVWLDDPAGPPDGQWLLHESVSLVADLDAGYLFTSGLYENRLADDDPVPGAVEIHC